ncbi:MAG: gamma-glutamylcyclotransferase [Candidatus Latescibacteria bacterium]|nr:gamma-glutamylcyclotransferase [Candidatus Latescibacterota bacterium]
MARSADTRVESNRGTAAGIPSSGAQTGLVISLFVYGTLKRGYLNHNGYCRGVLAIEEGFVRGQLYVRADRIPFLEVPERDVLATGTSDPVADAATQERLARHIGPHRLAECHPGPPPSSPDVVHGELHLFDDPETRLPAIDRLEGFHPGGRSLYRRVLVPVTVNEMYTVAWTYAVETKPPDWPKLASGCWTG